MNLCNGPCEYRYDERCILRVAAWLVSHQEVAVYPGESIREAFLKLAKGAGEGILIGGSLYGDHSSFTADCPEGCKVNDVKAAVDFQEEEVQGTRTEARFLEFSEYHVHGCRLVRWLQMKIHHQRQMIG